MTINRSRFAVVAVLFASCEDDPVRPLPDLLPPVVEVISPSIDGYDADSDGLVDVRMAWPNGDVNPASVRVHALDGIGHSSDGIVDLLEVWDVVRLDSAGVVLRETIDNLLHPDASRIQLSAADSAGNVWVDTVEIDLPRMSLHREQPLAVDLPYDAVHCADDGRLWVSGGAIVALDGTTFEEVARVDEIDTARVLCVPGHPYLFFTGSDGGVIHRPTMEVQEAYANTIGLAWTSLDPGHFYAGGISAVENNILVFRADAAVVDEFISVPPRPTGDEFLTALAISDRARKIYVSVGGGVRVVDFDTRQAGDTLRSGGQLTFSTYDMRMSPDGSRLYVGAVGQQTGLATFDVHNDTALFIDETPSGRPIRLAVSPSGQRVFVTTQSRLVGGMSSNYLFEYPIIGPVAEFPRRNETGNTRLDSAAAFRSDGKLLFNAYELYATSEAFLEIYLNREHRPPGSPGAYEG